MADHSQLFEGLSTMELMTSTGSKTAQTQWVLVQWATVDQVEE